MAHILIWLYVFFHILSSYVFGHLLCRDLIFLVLWLLLQVLFKDFRFRATDASSNTNLFFLAWLISTFFVLVSLVLILMGVILRFFLFGTLAALSESLIIMGVSIGDIIISIETRFLLLRDHLGH